MNEVKIYKPVLCFKQGLQLTKIYSPEELEKIDKKKNENTFLHPSITYRRLSEIPSETEGDTSWFPGKFGLKKNHTVRHTVNIINGISIRKE